MDRKIESSLKGLIARRNHWQGIMHSASRSGWRLGLRQTRCRDSSLDGRVKEQTLWQSLSRRHEVGC